MAESELERLRRREHIFWITLVAIAEGNPFDQRPAVVAQRSLDYALAQDEEAKK